MLPILYGIGAGLARLAPAAYRGYRTFKKARQVGGLGTSKAAQAGTGGFPIGYQGTAAQRIIGSRGKGLSSGSGLQGLTTRFTKRNPGTAGSLEAGFGLQLGAQGTGDIIEGAREGDMGAMVSGIGSVLLGTPLVARGLRIAGGQRTFAKKFPETAKAFKQTGKQVYERIPTGTSLVGFGGIVGGELTRDRTGGAQAGEPQVIGDDPVRIVINAIENDKKNPNIDTTKPEYKKQAQEILTMAYEQADEAGIKSAVTADQIAETFNFQTNDPNLKGNLIDETKLIKDNGQISGTTMSDEEIADTAKMQEGAASAGKKLKEKALSEADSAEAEQFNRFYERIKNLTGGNDKTNDLILMKLATGLMQGKTAESGIRGFIDVLGKAGGETVDTAMALYAKEADRRNDLAVAFLKSKEKGKDDGINRGFGAVTGTRQRILVEDPNALFGRVAYDKDVFKKSGTDAIMIPKYNEQGQEIGTEYVPMKYAEYNVIKPSQTRLDKKRTQLGSIALGYKMTNEIQRLSNKAIGGSGVLSLGVENIGGAVSNFAEMLGFGDISSAQNSEIDNTIVNDMIMGEALDKQTGEIRALTEEERKEQNELVKEFRKEIRGILDNVTSDGTMSEITRAKLIETRMKYILANANKDEDRLTRADIEDAANNTEIFKIFTSDRKIRSQYKDLNNELQEQFRNKAQQFIALGGNTRYLTTNFAYMPEVAKYLKDQETKLAGATVIQNMNTNLESIK